MTACLTKQNAPLRTGPESGECAARALILAEVCGLMAEEWGMHVLWYNPWLKEMEGGLDVVHYTVKSRFLICAS